MIFFFEMESYKNKNKFKKSHFDNILLGFNIQQNSTNFNI